MVAYSQPHGLPYQTAGDKRRDAPKVWRQVADMLEARLNAADDVRRRVQSPPMAVVRRTAPFVFDPFQPPSETIDGDGPFPFDAVLIDTDGMVDLSADARVVTPRVSGWYMATGYVKIASPSAGAGDSFTLFIRGGFDGQYIDSQRMSQLYGYNNVINQANPSARSTYYITATSMSFWDTSLPVITAFQLDLGIVNTGSLPLTITECGMAVCWVADPYW